MNPQEELEGASQGAAAYGEPYCNHCGYRLTGLVESSKCPECGRPLVEVLARRGSQQAQGGRRYRSRTTIFGLPLVHVALGPGEGKLRGQARGIIAIGDVATGVLAIGGFARGVIAFGGLALGLVGFGGLGVGLVAALGGMSVGGLTVGGAAIGGVAQGGLAVGVIADGSLAVRYVARGVKAVGRHTFAASASSPRTDPVLQRWTWLIGRRIGRPALLAWVAAAFGVVVVLALLVVLAGYVTARDDVP